MRINIILVLAVVGLSAGLSGCRLLFTSHRVVRLGEIYNLKNGYAELEVTIPCRNVPWRIEYSGEMGAVHNKLQMAVAVSNQGAKPLKVYQAYEPSIIKPGKSEIVFEGAIGDLWDVPIYINNIYYTKDSKLEFRIETRFVDYADQLPWRIIVSAAIHDVL